MGFLKAAVVLQQLVKGNRHKAVDVHTGVQRMIPNTKQRPKIRVCVGMNVSVNHIGLFGVFPGEKRVMAKRPGGRQ